MLKFKINSTDFRKLEVPKTMSLKEYKLGLTLDIFN